MSDPSRLRGTDAATLVRQGLVALTAIGIFATAFELATERHWNGVEQLIPWPSDHGPSTFVLLLALLPIVLFPFIAVLVVLGALAWAALRRWPAAGRLWWSAPVTVAGRALGIGATAIATIALAQDVAEIL